MSELSYLEKLLDGVEVEWKSLGDVVNFQRGRRLVKSQLETRGKYAVYQNSMTPLGYYHEYNVAAQSSFIICAGAAGEIGYSENEFWAADDVHFAITPEYINDRFLFHFLLTQKNKISGQVRRASIPRLSKSVIEKLEFPIPCPDNPEKSLAIQSEIVRILDKFTALTAELTAELTMRKKQYNYYRDQLLSFDDDEVEWKTLGEIGTWHGGGTPSKSRSEFWEDGSIPWISPKDMGRPIVDTSEDYITEEAVEQSSTKLVPANSIAIVVRSSILDKVMPSALIPVPATFNQDMKVVIPHCNISPNYIAHIMRSRGDDILRAAKKSGGSVASIDSKKLFSFRIPVPHLNEQKRIVNILDKFDTLANSITEGLPREIELRQKQYEYYRDLLFSFPRPETASN
ncbi:restriction endonuclease subunit S [Escherichia coli]|uniref:restriction endonuclease subunit S n=1 Tax=Escherichia coli TaxID=562 RepID=UPI000BE607CF|nr:restriction endonuclease subunit S [Escherichia coli]EIZ0224469.1 restriction endonuclease subunit S [Escherichia coli]